MGFEVGATRGCESWMMREGGVQGYSHCIPYGCDELVMRLFPLDPGYEMRICACTAAAATSAVNMLPSMASFPFLRPGIALESFSRRPRVVQVACSVSPPRSLLCGCAVEDFAPVVEDSCTCFPSRFSRRVFAFTSLTRRGSQDSIPSSQIRRAASLKIFQSTIRRFNIYQTKERSNVREGQREPTEAGPELGAAAPFNPQTLAQGIAACYMWVP